jgi:hypothetical protein
MRLLVKKFNPAEMKPHRTVLIVGRRGSGKSTLMEDLLMHMARRVDFGLFFTPTEESATVFRRHAPESWCYDSFNQPKIEEMLGMQRDLSRTNQQRSLLIVLDDCMYDKKVLKSTCIRDLHMNGRHLRVQFVTCVQYLMDVGPELRSNIDYVFCLKEPIYSNQVKLWKYFFGVFKSFDDFASVLARCTSNYSCLVLDNTAKTCELADTLSWYRASPDLPAYRIGSDVYWRLAARHTKTPEERARDSKERRTIERIERLEKNGKKKDRVTVVQRQDKRGRTLKEDRGEWIALGA